MQENYWHIPKLNHVKVNPSFGAVYAVREWNRFGLFYAPGTHAWWQL